MTPQLLATLYAPTPLTTCALYAPHLSAAMSAGGVTTVNRQAAFLGQVGVESSRLTRVEENLRYSTPARLDAMFSAVRGVADAAALIRRGPVAIGNRVYAGRLGNGDEASGDGWRYRGAGLIQLTGRTAQAAFGADIGMPLAKVPAYLLTPEGAARSAVWYWRTHGCNALADAWDLDGVTRAVNGSAMVAAAERAALSVTARRLLHAGR